VTASAALTEGLFWAKESIGYRVIAPVDKAHTAIETRALLKKVEGGSGVCEFINYPS
jgi:hypothetical protein